MRTQERNQRNTTGMWRAGLAGTVLLLTAANCFGQFFTVLEPDGGEVYGVGGTMTVRWSGGNPMASVIIVLSRDGGATWPTIVATNAPNTGAYEWTNISGPASTHCRIGVGTSLPDADTSDADFTIRQIVKPAVVTLSATQSSCGSVTLRGQLNDDGGEPCRVRFSYCNDLTPPIVCFPGYTTTWQEGFTTGQTFTATVTLVPGEHIEFEARAENSAGGSWGGVQTFDAPDGVVVPSLAGMTKSQAEAELNEVGLVLGTITGDALGKVTSQNPPAGKEVCPDSAVAITLVRVQVKVPNLIGMQENEVDAVLNAAKLALGTTSYGPSDLPPGTVYSQDPKAGSTVWEDTEVSVIVSQSENEGPIYVDADAKGKNNGLNWTDAFTKLQDGLTAANVHRNLIYVAEGVYTPDLGGGYTPGDRMASFRLRNGVTIKGGFAGFGKPNPDARDIGRYETVLSGNIGDPLDKADNSLHVVMAVKCDASTVLDGLTIADGNASLETTPENRGAGLFNNPASLKVIDCTFRDNFASWFGAGMYNNYSSKSEPNVIRCSFFNNRVNSNGAAVYSHSTCNPTFTDCLFQANTAGSAGAAVQVYMSSATLTDCNFIDNKAKAGGAVYGSQDDTKLINCTFTGNSATDQGGALKNDKGVIALTDCTFTDNMAPRGGALLCTNESQPMLDACVFVGNTASVHGGAIFTDLAQIVMSGCAFLDNFAVTNGGAMWLYRTDAWAVNCTFGGNLALFAGGAGVHASESEFTGCVFTGNGATNDGGGLGITNCTRPTYVTNCTFSRNSATNRGAGIYDANSVTTVNNSILWANTSAQGPQIALANKATMTVQRCDVQDGQAKAYVIASTLTWGTGNLTSDPRFVDADGPDNVVGTADDRLDLLAGSPCIDAGDNRKVPSDVADVDNDANTTERLPLDIADRPRFVDIPASANTGVADPPIHPAIVDMGAYERSL